MVDSALDSGADALIAMTAPVAQVAINATLDLDDPPIILFTTVYFSRAAGIAQSTCVKPAHVTGVEVALPYEKLLDLVLLQQPDLSTIGLYHNITEISGIIGAEIIAQQAEERGINVVQNSVVDSASVNIALEGLFSKGAQALLLPVDSITVETLPVASVMAAEYGVPIYFPTLPAVSHGATVSLGFYSQWDQAMNVGRILAAHLRGDVDISRHGIQVFDQAGIGVNLDYADASGITIASAILERAYLVIDKGKSDLSDEFVNLLKASHLNTDWEDLMAADAAYFQSLQCTDEMIAEQQAAVDAASR